MDVENLIMNRWIEDLALLTELPSKVTDRTEERKRQLRKLKSDLHALQKIHQVTTKHLPAVPKNPEQRFSHSEIKQHPVSKQPKITMEPEVSMQSDPEYDYIKVEITSRVRSSQTQQDRPALPPPRNASLRMLASKNHVVSSRVLDDQNHAHSPRRLLRMFAERFNKRRSVSPVRRTHGTHGFVRRPPVLQQSSIVSSMMSGSGCIYASRSCQLSSAECTKTMSLPTSRLITELSQNENKQELLDEKQNSFNPPSLSNGEHCISLSELSSIHHVNDTTRGDCPCCHQVVDESLQYPKASTPTVAAHLSSTSRDNTCTKEDSSPTGTPQLPRSTSSGSKATTVKRTLSETFTVFPGPGTPPSTDNAHDGNITNLDPGRPKVQPSMGVRAKLNQVSAASRPQCLGAERTINTPSNTEVVAMDMPFPNNGNQTVDSDATRFMQAPLCQKAVTYKMKVSRRSKVKGQLKGLGRQIRELGPSKLNLHTLAVL